MNYFLAKTEPKVYSIDDLQREGTTGWDGVRNPQAVQTILQMRAGDRLLIYHSGAQAGVAGAAEITSEGRPDPKEPKSALIDIRYMAHLSPPTLLSEIKASNLFSEWALVRQGRLSTMSVPDEFVRWLRGRYPTVQL